MHALRQTTAREEQGNGDKVGSYLFRVEPLGHGPGGDHIIHDTLTQRLGDFMKLHEFPYVVQHVMVLGRGRRHLLDDGRDVTKDRRIQQGCGRIRVGGVLLLGARHVPCPSIPQMLPVINCMCGSEVVPRGKGYVLRTGKRVV